MRKSFRFLTVVVVIAMVAALGLANRPASAQTAVVIHWWHESTTAPQVAYWQGLADAYTKLHPNVTFEITNLENEAYKAKLATVMQAGDPPDLFWSWGGGVLWNFASAGLTRNIAPELNANGGEWKNSFAATAALELYGQNGEYYGVPFDWGAVGMFYNKALFAKAKLDPNSPPKTWTDLITDVKALKAAGITPIAIGEKDKWPGHFWYGYLATREGGQSAFLAAYKRTGSFSDAPFVKAFADLKQLVDLNAFQDGFLAAAYGDAETVMGNGQAAMELMGQWSPSTQITNSANGKGIGADLGWFPFPVIEGGKGNPTDVFGGGDGFAVGKNAPDAAVDFLKFLTSSDNQIAGAAPAISITVPPTVKGTDSVIANDPILTAIVAARNGAPYFQLYYDQFLPPALAGTILDSAEAVFAGADTPEQAAQAIEDSAKTELAPAAAATMAATAAK
jgi:raffinose/stachyose/melibiose transport system substrate-binding protein